MGAAKKVIILTNMLAPYRVPVFNALTEWGRYTFKIGFLTTREANREWTVRTSELLVRYDILPGCHKFIGHFDMAFHFNSGVWTFLRRESPDAIIVGGYAYPAYWLALLYAKAFPCKLVMWSGSTLQSIRLNSRAIRVLRSWFIRQMDAYICYSSEAARFIEAHGGARNAIFIGYNVGEVDYFRSAAESLELYRGKPEDGHVIILFVGQLIPRKGLHLAIPALGSLEDRNWTLLVAGSGREQERLLSLAKEYGLEANISFLGFQQREDLARLYAKADIFLFPTIREPAEIVLSEALASGLFALASKYSGIASDLIQPGHNGYFIDPWDKEQMKRSLEEAFQRVREGKVSRAQIRESIAEFTPKRYAAAFIKALDCAMGDALLS